jgi:hypothetical protein
MPEPPSRATDLRHDMCALAIEHFHQAMVFVVALA